MGCGELVAGFLRRVNDGVILTVHVHPGARRSGIVVEEDGVHAYVREPPRGGRANEGLIRLFKKMGLKASIIGGSKSRVKEILLEGAEPAMAARILCQHS
ncbi:MAG: DUF167 domain-containing protein [Desulfurococcales archaeon]|nr:DUF167 domain-containing protein [Desulfurococcales archaeon]